MHQVNDADIYLASQSPRRRELLMQIGVRHRVINPQVPELRAADESPVDYISRLARQKADAGFRLLKEQALTPKPVLGADTIGVLDGSVLEKPRDAEHAKAMLLSLAGRCHQVLTAVAMVDDQRTELLVSSTEVYFRPLCEVEAMRYWATGEPKDKAGGYAIQGLGAVFVEQIIGSYSNVVGLPIECVTQLLTAFDVPWWQSQTSYCYE